MCLQGSDRVLFFLLEKLLSLPVAGFLYETSLNFTFKRKAYEDRINESFSLLPALTVYVYAYQYFVLFLPATS